MANPNDTELLPPSGAVTRLPSLGSPELSTEYLARIKEILEALLGRRGGSDWDRAVTFRDLHGMGLSSGAGGGWTLMGGDTGGAIDTSSPGFAQFVGRVSAEIERSAAFRSLKTRIGSAESNEHLPAEIKRQLQLGLQQVARDRQAAIETVENKIQTSALSMASRLTEISAALERTAAGVREFDVAYADRTQAIALKVTQLIASLDNGTGGDIELEERFAAIASAIDGLKGQWSIKIQTSGTEFPVIAGIALAVEDPVAGPGTSSLIFMAEKFGFVTQNGTTTPFVIVGDQIEFNGNVRINGQLVIGEDGLQPGFEAPGTKNSELNIGLGAGNKISNSGPYPGSLGDFSVWANNTGMVAELAPSYDPYRPAGNGGVWMRIPGTPGANAIVDVTDIKRPVVGRQRYEFSVYVSTHRCDAMVYCAWYKADGSLSDVSEGLYVFENLASGYALDAYGRPRLFATAPVDAVAVMMRARARFHGLANPSLFMSMWYAGPALPAQTVPSEWSDGPTGAAALRDAADAQATADAAQQTATDAADALPGINAAITEKLSKTGNEEIYGQKSLMSQYAILVGTVNDGIIHGSTGLYGRNGGYTMFSIGANGRAIFADQLMAAWGTFGAVSIAAGGSLGVGATGYNTDTGIWFGYAGGNPKMSIRTANGSTFLCDPAANVLSFNGATINNPTMDSFTASLSGSAGGSYPNGSSGYGTITANPVGGKLPHSYLWTLVERYRTGGAGNMAINSATSQAVSLSGSGSDATLSYALTCIVTDANNRSVTLYRTVIANHGTPP